MSSLFADTNSAELVFHFTIRINITNLSNVGVETLL